MAQQLELEASPPMTAPTRREPMSFAWIGVAPFFLFAFLFLILPTLYLVVGAFQDAAGNFTLANLGKLADPTIISAFRISIEVSLASAVVGAIIGFFLAYAVILGGLPAWLRPTLLTFSGVASNFAGVPLAFAFIATLGRTGLITALLIKFFDFNIYSAGFNLLSFTGLTLTYLQDILRARSPRNLRTACLLSKPSRRKVEVKVEYIGFTIEDKFVVGYGLDYAEKYRNLPHIAVLQQ